MSAVEILPRPRLTLSPMAVSFVAVLVEGATIVIMAVLAGATYTSLKYGTHGELANFLMVGCLTAWLFALPFVFREDYRTEAILEGRRNLSRLFIMWTCAFLVLAAIGFLTKSSALFSRGWMVTFYLAGFAAVLGVNFLVRQALLASIDIGLIARRKLMIISVDQDVRMTARDLMGKNSCAEVTAVVKFDARAGRDDFKPSDLDNAVSWARSLNIDDVVILADWSRSSNIDQIVSAFTVLPAAIHVGAASVVGKFSRPRISHLGQTCVLSLKGRPLEPGQAIVKRAFDVVAAALALVLLAPLFAAVMIAIRLDSNGPSLFLQRRRGYNQRVFQIWKFRTMTVMDDGDSIVQAQRNDARVTRVGRILRRYNIDELPQLVNVLRGEMSLVGPRPHAVAHDRMYETSIMQYPRRLNMRPGITGWAQVNGLRGQTETDRVMAKRLEYDLHYIDNWSIGLDFYIILLTVLSPRAYRNAH
ncbi:MAG: exopolysaccharide biosynthesis polyprenyl glycosylphosphotransferase [Hyphomicrobiaceae bacterium]|nr:exopolysaccharide biosynthesis polyprenyl glycosylphosphotransferase [Hyphomicrobiaceae bacterium]